MADVTGCFSVAVEPGAHQFQAAGDSSLLESARLSNIILPSSCRNGTCRECMCRMVSGRVKYKIEWPGLSAEEKADGYILPCVALPESDLVINAPRALKTE
ncbi:MAG: ferredoxin [Burkholderia sp.]|jgi:ferredoxin|nr:ferredoxin [Burkholderia sp.]